MKTFCVKTFWMKTGPLALGFSLALAGLSAGARADGTPAVTKPSDAADAVSAEVGVTRDALQKLLRDAQSGGANDANYDHADYKRNAVEFVGKADAAMTAFETTLKTKLLAPYRDGIAQYNAINASTAYTAEEKAALLTQVYATISSWEPTFLEGYRTELVKLIELTGLAPLLAGYRGGGYGNYSYAFDVQSDDGSFYERISAATENFYDADTNVNAYNSLFDDYVYPRLAQTCYSQSCVLLESVLFSDYIKLIGTNFVASNLTLTLADGKVITLRTSTVDATAILGQAAGARPLPEAAQALPFDCKDVDAAVAVRHDAKIAALVTALQQPKKKRKDLAEGAMAVLRDLAALPALDRAFDRVSPEEKAAILKQIRHGGLFPNHAPEWALEVALKAVGNGPLDGRSGD